MPDKKIKIILTNYPDSHQKKQKIKLGVWATDEQKQRFLNFIKAHNIDNDGIPMVNTKCSFNVHFDKSLIHSCEFDVPKQFTPLHSQNKKNEVIIEIIPGKDCECWPMCSCYCLDCIQSGACPSPFISKYIGELFPDKYQKQR